MWSRGLELGGSTKWGCVNALKKAFAWSSCILQRAGLRWRGGIRATAPWTQAVRRPAGVAASRVRQSGAPAADFGGQILQHCCGNCRAIRGGCSAPQFVQRHNAAAGSRLRIREASLELCVCFQLSIRGRTAAATCSICSSDESCIRQTCPAFVAKTEAAEQTHELTLRFTDSLLSSECTAQDSTADQDADSPEQNAALPALRIHAAGFGRITCSMEAVSESSTKKVDWPAMIWSRAPMRTNTASAGDSRSAFAGTQPPT